MQRKLSFLLASMLSVLAITVLSITSEQLQSHAENVQIIFDPIFGHNHNGTNSAKLAANSVNTTQIVDSSVTNSKIAGPISVAKGGTGLTSLGSANQVLKVNSGGTALEYATSSSGSGQDGDMSYKLSTTIGDYSAPTGAIASSVEIANYTFEDDYTTSSGWTQVGTLVTVDSGVADKVFCNACPGNADNRVYKGLGVTLSDTSWRADFDYKITTALASDLSHIPFILAAGTATPDTTSQDAIGILVQNLAGQQGVDIYYRDGSTPVEGSRINLAASTQYYLRLEKTDATNARLSVFSDSARTNHVSGSPVDTTIPSTITNLTTLHHFSRTFSAGTGSWEVDNTKINSNSSILNAANAIDSNTSTLWKSNSTNKPWIRLDLGANKDLAQFAMHLDRTNTTATTLKIYSSTDTTFTSGEVIAYVNVSDLTDDTWRFILNNRLPENKRYMLIEAQENPCVLAINEVKYREITDWNRHFHAKRDVTTANSFLDSN